MSAVTGDGEFVIDRAGPVTVLAGFGDVGLGFAPIIGAYAADLVDGRAGIRRFALDRGLPVAVGAH